MKERSPIKEFHILNLGAGVQSTCLYLMFMEGRIVPQLDAAIFADTQDEPREVYKHLEWLESLKGPRIIRVSIGKLSDALIQGINSTGQPWISIPAFTRGEKKEGRLRRQCSKEFKIIPIQQAIRRQCLGLAPRSRVPRGIVVHQYLGISLDESGRAARIAKTKRPKYLRVHFPLIEMNAVRSDCLAFLEKRVPHLVPKSACRYCPFHDDAEWARIKADPVEWSEAVKVDEALRSECVSQNRKRKNNEAMFLHRSLVPLRDVVFSIKPAAKQGWIGFAAECMGVCGI